MAQANKNNKGVDLSGALKDSSSDLKLDEEQRYAPSFDSDSGTPKMIQWVIKYSGGLVKDEKQASHALIGFVTAAIIVALFLIFGKHKAQEVFTPEAEAPPTEVVPPAKF